MLYSQLFSLSLKKFNAKDKTLDLQLLMEAAFGLTREQFWTKKNEEITDNVGLRKFYRYLGQLRRNVPIAYILKKKEFYGETFFVNRNVLIPRPETEILVEQALAVIKSPIKVLDIGAGSGNIAILLAKRAGAVVTAVEKSRKAFYVLKKNIAWHGLKGKVIPVCGDLFPAAVQRFEVIVSNPPYVGEAEWRGLDPSVRDHEPPEALVAEEDGLSIIRRIVIHADYFLVPGGKLLLEIGYNQKEQVGKILAGSKFSGVDFFNDYSGIPRVVLAHLEKALAPSRGSKGSASSALTSIFG